MIVIVAYDLQKEDNESPLEFAIRNGWGLYMYQMFCIDYLIREYRYCFQHMVMKNF